MLTASSYAGAGKYFLSAHRHTDTHTEGERAAGVGGGAAGEGEAEGESDSCRHVPPPPKLPHLLAPFLSFFIGLF